MSTGNQIVFNPESWTKGGNILDEAMNKVKAEIDKLIDKVTDFKILGEKDIVGKVVNFLYRVFIEVVREILKGLVDAIADKLNFMKQVGKNYADTADSAQLVAAQVGKDFG